MGKLALAFFYVLVFGDADERVVGPFETYADCVADLRVYASDPLVGPASECYLGVDDE